MLLVIVEWNVVCIDFVFDLQLVLEDCFNSYGYEFVDVGLCVECGMLMIDVYLVQYLNDLFVFDSKGWVLYWFGWNDEVLMWFDCFIVVFM